MAADDLAMQGARASAAIGVAVSICPFDQEVLMHFQINCSGNWPQALWIHSLWDSPGLINFWSCSTEFPLFPGLWLVKQFSGKPFITLTSTLVETFVMGLLTPDYIWAVFTWIAIISWPFIGQAVCAHFLANHSSYWLQTMLVHSQQVR